MLCDVCNSPIENKKGDRITADAFRYLLINGFGIDPVNIQILESSGMSQSEAIDILRQQYMTSTSDWLLCSICVAKAKALISSKKEKWIDSEHIAVTVTAEEVGHGYDIMKAPVALTRSVWNQYVQWTKEDNKNQCYQEQDARLWDILFTGGATLQWKINQFFKTGMHYYSIFCIPRDGISNEAIEINLVMRSVEMHNNHWLVVDLS